LPAVILAIGLVMIFLRGEWQNARGLDKLILFGPLFYAAPIAAFGTEHFKVTENIASVMPGWIPSHRFWVYLVGTPEVDRNSRRLARPVRRTQLDKSSRSQGALPRSTHSISRICLDDCRRFCSAENDSSAMTKTIPSPSRTTADSTARSSTHPLGMQQTVSFRFLVIVQALP
jgi:hypothetical protein